MEPNKNNLPEDCDPVEIIDQKTGLEKFVYMCTKPFEDRFAHYKKNSLHFWTDLVLATTVIILISVIISLYVYNRTSIANMVDFEVAYDQAQLINGKNVEFVVKYNNTSKRTPAIDAAVTVRLPKSLHNIRVLPTDVDLAKQDFPIGTLTPQMSGEFKVSGLLIGNLNEDDKFLFVLSYHTPTGLAQQEFTSRDFTITQSVISASLKLPGKIIIGSAFPSAVSLQNSGDQAFENLRAKLVYPAGYASDNLTINFDKLDPKSSQEKISTGTLSNSQPGTQDFVAQIITTIDGADFVLTSTTSKGELSFSKLLLQITDSEKTSNINPGDQIDLQVKLENGEVQKIDDLNVSVILSGAYLDQKFLQDKYKDQYQNGTVQLPELKTIDAGQSILSPITVAALPFITIKDKPIQNQDISVIIRATYTLDHENTIFVNSKAFTLSINSTLNLSSAGIFTTKEGDQIGVGSIPPRPGEYTAYWAVLSLANGVNKVRNVTVHAIIPANVEYADVSNVTNGVSIRTINGGKTIEWYIPELEAYDGILNAPSQARLQLAITPDDIDIGKILPLLTNITVTGVDDRTGYVINGNAKAVTTAIFNDPKKDRVTE